MRRIRQSEATATGRLPSAGDVLQPTELVPDRLFILGDSVLLDGRISWMPADATGWQPINCYLAVEGDSALVIDPGPVIHRETLVAQLDWLLPAGMPVSIFITRAEQDAFGNLGGIGRSRPIQHLYAGGLTNPFDAFEYVDQTGDVTPRERVQMERLPVGYQIPVGTARGVEVLSPTLRLLSTWWAYDNGTQTLFTSDVFGHTVQKDRFSPRVLHANDECQCDVATIKRQLTCKFWWLAVGKTPAIRDSLVATFSERTVSRIAPGHGLVIEGEECVRQHFVAMTTALEELAS